MYVITEVPVSLPACSACSFFLLLPPSSPLPPFLATETNKCTVAQQGGVRVCVCVWGRRGGVVESSCSWDRWEDVFLVRTDQQAGVWCISPAPSPHPASWAGLQRGSTPLNLRSTELQLCCILNWSLAPFPVPDACHEDPGDHKRPGAFRRLWERSSIGPVRSNGGQQLGRSVSLFLSLSFSFFFLPSSARLAPAAHGWQLQSYSVVLERSDYIHCFGQVSVFWEYNTVTCFFLNFYKWKDSFSLRYSLCKSVGTS